MNQNRKPQSESGINRRLHFLFFPFMVSKYIIQMTDMAKLFGSWGCKPTFITVPSYEPAWRESVTKAKLLGFDTSVVAEGEPSLDVTSSEMLNKAEMLWGPQLEWIIDKLRPDCLVSGTFFPWRTKVEATFGIPTLVFHGATTFALAGTECLRLYKPHKMVSSDSELFTIPNFPGEITLTWQQLPAFVKDDAELSTLNEVKESEKRSDGAIVNRFYELEPAYADHYQTFLGRRTWHVGPLLLCKNNIKGKEHTDSQASIDQHECLKWLYSKKPNSVIYICFETMVDLSAAALPKISLGLVESGQQFIWVVQKDSGEPGKEEWLPDGYESRIQDKGLIIRGYAPQLLILDHGAVGRFMTCCRWDSTLGAISAGVPLVAWTFGPEQFFIEEFVTKVPGIGVSVEVKQWERLLGNGAKKESVEEAVWRAMKGAEAEEMRRRAKALAEMAKVAVEEGGSSRANLNALLEEIIAQRSAHMYT